MEQFSFGPSKVGGPAPKLERSGAAPVSPPPSVRYALCQIYRCYIYFVPNYCILLRLNDSVTGVWLKQKHVHPQHVGEALKIIDYACHCKFSIFIILHCKAINCLIVDTMEPKGKKIGYMLLFSYSFSSLNRFFNPQFF